ncbi:glutamine amidotransferase [Zhengella sp. ZM62]
MSFFPMTVRSSCKTCHDLAGTFPAGIERSGVSDLEMHQPRPVVTETLVAVHQNRVSLCQDLSICLVNESAFLQVPKRFRVVCFFVGFGALGQTCAFNRRVSMKPFLIIQLRPEAEASDNEFEAFLEKGGLAPGRVHRLRLERETMPRDMDLSAYAGVIVGGGPGCVSDPQDEKPDMERRIEDEVMSLMPAITARDIPFLGCCYGIGILAHHLGGRVSKDCYGEPVGVTRAVLTGEGRNDPVLAGLPDAFDAFVGHKEAVQALPPGCAHLVSGPDCPFQMIRHGQNVYATQFHPEADGDVFALRIRIYRDKGYFRPEDADALTARARKGNGQASARILRNFVERYG